MGLFHICQTYYSIHIAPLPLLKGSRTGMGSSFSEVLVGETKREDSMFYGSLVEGTCQGWSIFP